ncbi:hypothetical protein QJS10_CPA02g00083 [Acorus calamus]|uniref:EVE domain-containing protein n=1 Tax=Acorus calamus TaxID=4465 RepID=A0AAV9FCF8_ACOCL|nr:hypothetical protein QJS10_CPA02g00083 [Acorus calamus]
MKHRRYWLLKTEPKEWSWEDQTASPEGTAQWDGVKNRQAQNNLRSMKKGDLCFFYHSGPSDRRVMGTVEVVKEWYDINDGGGGAVDVRVVGRLRRAVELKEMKGEEGFRGFVLLKQPRLSVVPVPGDVWERVIEMGGGYVGEDDEEEEVDEVVKDV